MHVDDFSPHVKPVDALTQGRMDPDQNGAATLKTGVLISERSWYGRQTGAALSNLQKWRYPALGTCSDCHCSVGRTQRMRHVAHELKLNIFPHLKEGIFGGYHPLPVIASTEGQCHSSTTINDMFRRSFSVSAMATGKIRLVITALLVSGVVFPRISAELRNMSSHKGAVRRRSRIPFRHQWRGFQRGKR